MLVHVHEPCHRLPVDDPVHLLPLAEPLEAALLPPDVVGGEAVVPTSLNVERGQVHAEA